MSDVQTFINATRHLQHVQQLARTVPNESHLVVSEGTELLELCTLAKQQGYYLCTLVVCDERLLEDSCFKLYYVLSASPHEASPGQLIVIEYPVPEDQHPLEYPSIRGVFRSVIPLEQQSYRLFGLASDQLSDSEKVDGRLEPALPSDSFPLRRDYAMSELGRTIGNTAGRQSPQRTLEPEGRWILPVGPIHAGIIEAGQFPFHVAGEIVEALPIKLAYKHKGIEKLFETRYMLENGSELAERVSGDSSFAHSMAYCRAVESIAGVEPLEAAVYWRALFLELERIYNHIADVSALAHDIAFDLVAAPLSILREEAVQLNQRLTGHRLLRGINRPGGILLPKLNEWPRGLADAARTIEHLTTKFLKLSGAILDMPACRERMLTTGMLTAPEVVESGATGLAARAAGLSEHDFRLRHPIRPYDDPEIQAAIRVTVSDDNGSSSRRMPVFAYDLKGDVFARLAIRVAEVETLAQLVQLIVTKLRGHQRDARLLNSIEEPLRDAPNFEFGLGYVEGWRGEVCYWIMKGPANSIFRCAVRDPSIFNWPAMSQAVVRKLKSDEPQPHGSDYWENILADFPLINKSFNLSYSGNDL